LINFKKISISFQPSDTEAAAATGDENELEKEMSEKIQKLRDDFNKLKEKLGDKISQAKKMLIDALEKRLQKLKEIEDKVSKMEDGPLKRLEVKFLQVLETLAAQALENLKKDTTVSKRGKYPEN
jgi:hypothetical protein